MQAKKKANKKTNDNRLMSVLFKKNRLQNFEPILYSEEKETPNLKLKRKKSETNFVVTQVENI